MGVYIIAEAGVNHNGNLELAKKLVKMAADCGADAVKFQTFKSYECASEYVDLADYQKKTVNYTSQMEMIRSLELPFTDFAVLKDYATSLNIDFISTPDGQESLDYLTNIDVPVIKISSTDVTNLRFVKQIASKNKPMILSTGMSTLGEVEQAIETITGMGNDKITLMHCTTAYPTEVTDVNLRAMCTMRDAFKLPVGYSDHTLGNEAAVAAVALGAVCIEKHITLDRTMPGPDHQASCPPEEFKDYVRAIRDTEKLLGTGIKKPTEVEIRNKVTVRRGLVASCDIPEGTIIDESMICIKRPGVGIEPCDIDKIIGMKINKRVDREFPIMWDHFK